MLLYHVLIYVRVGDDVLRDFVSDVIWSMFMSWLFSERLSFFASLRYNGWVWVLSCLTLGQSLEWLSNWNYEQVWSAINASCFLSFSCYDFLLWQQMPERLWAQFFIRSSFFHSLLMSLIISKQSTAFHEALFAVACVVLWSVTYTLGSHSFGLPKGSYPYLLISRQNRHLSHIFCHFVCQGHNNMLVTFFTPPSSLEHAPPS